MSQEFTDMVKSSFGPKATPRARRILASLIQHIHDFARENFITTEEWMQGVEFINRIGQISDERRNEGILVSDVLGLEVLVDTQTHSLEHSDHTKSAILGPFYRPNSPRYPNGASIIQKEVGGEKTLFRGRILTTDGKPLVGAQLEAWHCAPNGLYEQQDPEQPDYNLRGTFETDSEGRFSFICLKPTAYPIPYDGPAGDLLTAMDRHPMRPSHIHFRATYPEYHALVTQIYNRDDPYVKDDSVYGVKEELVLDFVPTTDPELKSKDVLYTVDYEIRLTTEAEIQQERARLYELQSKVDQEFA